MSANGFTSFQLLPFLPHPTFQALSEGLFCVRHCDRHLRANPHPQEASVLGKEPTVHSMVNSTLEIGKTITNSRNQKRDFTLINYFKYLASTYWFRDASPLEKVFSSTFVKKARHVFILNEFEFLRYEQISGQLQQSSLTL